MEQLRESGILTRVYIGAESVEQHAKTWKETGKGRPRTVSGQFKQRGISPDLIGVMKDEAAPGVGGKVPAVAVAADGANAASASRFSVKMKTKGVGARAACMIRMSPPMNNSRSVKRMQPRLIKAE